eukprot:3528924-Pyramimonas_sp.AAC.1
MRTTRPDTPTFSRERHPELGYRCRLQVVPLEGPGHIPLRDHLLNAWVPCLPPEAESSKPS